jgi:hypothetical protein
VLLSLSLSPPRSLSRSLSLALSCIFNSTTTYHRYIASAITLSGNLAGEADIFGDLTVLSSQFDGVSADLSRMLWWTQPAEVEERERRVGGERERRREGEGKRGRQGDRERESGERRGREERGRREVRARKNRKKAEGGINCIIGMAITASRDVSSFYN